ncbi:MAG: mechanosensitive ion channel family protein, partial [Arcobacteraceae bacterium]
MPKNIFISNILKISLLFIVSLNLFADNHFLDGKGLLPEQNPTSIIQEKDNVDATASDVDPYDLGFIIKLIQNKNFKTHADKQIEKIDTQIEKIVQNINDEVVYVFDQKEYIKQINFFNSKININSKYDNSLAVSRDLIKISVLENNKNFAQTINAIIDAKNSFKNKKYFISLLDGAIVELEKIDLSEFHKTASEISELKDPISKDFKNSLVLLEGQIKANLLVLNYLKSNMNQYRPSNFILDELSLKYVIEKIDSHSYIKNVSEIFNYYFHISIGKIVILLFVFMFFYIINSKVLPFFTRVFNTKLSKKIKTLNISILDIVPSSFSFTVSIIIYVFALQLSLFLLIDKVNIVNQLVPWFNTVYLSLFSYMFYRILTNYINLSSDKIFNDYPNMRKEMVDFLLRILKILILICLVLFLLVQLGFDIKAIIASLGIGGIAIALAAKDTLTNFFGSLNIITDNSFSQGDWIEAGNVEGTVVDIRMRTTRIRTFANAMITVPNAQLANMSILNWSKRVIGRRIKMSLGITYGSKMSNIENLVQDIKEMLQEHPSIATSKLSIDKRPYLLKKEDLIGVKNNILVYIDEYANSSINILVYCFSRS